MGDMGDDFRALKQLGKEKRAKNTKSSTEILAKNRIEFESKNLGAHLIVNSNNGLIDFWPSTGKFKLRSSDKYQYGIKNLLQVCGVQK